MRPAALLLVTLAGCSSARPPAAHTTATPTGTETPITLQPSELRVMQGDAVACTLSADGRVAIDGRDFARIEATRVVAADGSPLARLDGRTLRFEGAARPAMLGDDGSVTGPEGQRMALNDRGEVEFTDPARAGERITLRTRVEGLTSAARPVAGVLVGVLMFRARRMDEGR